MSSVPPTFYCSPEDYERSLRDPNITCLGKDDTIGQIIIIGAGFLSLFSLLYVALMIARNIVWRMRHFDLERWKIFHVPIDIVMFSLLFADAILAISYTLSVQSVRDGKVELGALCTTQGIMKTFGSMGVALSTLMIAVYTFIGVWMGKDISSMRMTSGIVTGIWIFIAIIVTTGITTNHDPNTNFIAPTPFRCWINKKHLGWRIASEYMWWWITLLVSFLIYLPLFLLRNGNIEMEASWWRCHFRRPKRSDSIRRQATSLVMLAYPITYCIIILPLTICRWITLRQGERAVPTAASVAGTAIFGLSGFLNVILLLTTRPKGGLFGELMIQSPVRLPPISNGEEEEKDEDQAGLGVLPP